MSERGPGMLDRREPMSPRVRVALMSVIGLSFAAAVGVSIFSDKISRPGSSGNDTFSASAVGHRALRDTLRALDIPVLVSRIDPGKTAGNDRALLLVAEPPGADALADALEGAEVALVVLPKREAGAAIDRPGWVDASWLKPASEVAATLDRIAGGSIERVASAGRFDSEVTAAAPTADSLQIIRSDDSRIEPLVVTGDGEILVARVSMTLRQVYVLSDPDLIANHGLHRGDNALLVIDLIEHIRARHGLETVVIDETVHGFRAEASIWQSLFELPIAAATMAGVLALLFGLWAAGSGRFGPPEDPPIYAGGTEQLVENSAQLLTTGGHDGYALRRYLGITARAVADRLHTEPARLDAISERRSSHTLAALRDEVAQVAGHRRPQHRRLLAVAGKIHQWREEMIHGATGRPGTE